MEDDAMSEESHSIDINAILSADLDNCAEAPSGDPIKVGMVMDFSEAAGFVDVPGSEVVPYVASLANCAGGINGRPVEVDVRESGADPALATQELIDWGAQFFIGPPFADATLPMQQAGGGEYAIFAAASTEPTLADAANNTFLVTFDDVGQSSAAAEFALSQGFSRAIIFTEGEGVPYSGVNPDAFKETFTAPTSWSTSFSPRPSMSIAGLGEKPALLVWGERDWCFTPWFRQEFERRWPRAISRPIADAGHYVFEDATDAYLDSIAEFLADNPENSGI